MIHVDEVRINPGYIPNDTDGYHYWISVFSAYRGPRDGVVNPVWNGTPDLVEKTCVYSPIAIAVQYSQEMTLSKFVRTYRRVLKCST